MDVNQQSIVAMQAITISRQYGSGGGEIASRLARKLGWQLIDHAIVEQTAQELGVHESFVTRYDEEHVEDILSRTLNSIRNITTSGFIPVAQGAIPTPATPYASSHSMTNERAYQETMQQVIRAAVKKGHVVIVGRGGQFLLAERRDVLHVRIVAPLERRVAYVMHREQQNRADALTRVQEKDRARERNMQKQFRQNPGDPNLYDLVLNTAVLDLDHIVDLICLALSSKASQLSVATEELGPAAGLAPYQGKAGDFPVS